MKLTKILLPVLASSALIHAQNNYFFGDSLTDNGNLLLYSNGPTWANHLDASAVPHVSVTTPTTSSVNYAYSGATSGFDQPNSGYQVQTEFITDVVSGIVPVNAESTAYLWTGHNNILGALETADPGAALEAAIPTVVSDTVTSVATLDAVGVQNIVVLGVTNVGSTPLINSIPVPGLGDDVNDVVSAINASTLSTLQDPSLGLPSSGYLYVDTAYAIDTLTANPTAFGISPVSGETDETGVFITDGLHPSTQTHAVLAQYINKHLELEAQAPAMGLHFDLLRGFDETETFQFRDLDQGEIRSAVSAFGYTSSTTGMERDTQGALLELDYAFSEHLGIGIDFLAGRGEAGNAEFEGYGVALEKTLHFTLDHDIEVEAGGQLAFLKGTLERDLNLGSLETTADTWSISGDLFANARKGFTVGNREFELVLGVNHKVVQFDDVTESPDTSFSLGYGDETVQVTTANVELAYALSERSRVALLARPVLYSSDNDFQASQAEGLASYGIGDISGYDVHTYGAGFTQGFQFNETDGAFFGSFLLGSDDTMFGNIGVSFSF